MMTRPKVRGILIPSRSLIQRGAVINLRLLVLRPSLFFLTITTEPLALLLTPSDLRPKNQDEVRQTRWIR